MYTVVPHDLTALQVEKFSIRTHYLSKFCPPTRPCGCNSKVNKLQNTQCDSPVMLVLYCCTHHPVILDIFCKNLALILTEIKGGSDSDGVKIMQIKKEIIKNEWSAV